MSEKVTQFGELELHSELKAHDADDAFVDPQEGKDRRRWVFESKTKAGKGSRGQLIHYATEWFSCQHRHHAFTIFLFGRYVRFIRWDCTGAIVSEKFDFKTNCTFLVEFLWRFSHLDNAGRGRDPFVRRATPQEVEIAHRELEEWKPEAYRPVVVFTVPGEDGRNREFLAWGCLSENRSLTGRCTRPYPVYEIATKNKYLLKDAWQAHTLDKEADILRDLRDAQVEHVPRYFCGGDVGGGVTKTNLYVTVQEAKEGWEDEGEVRSHDEDGSWKCGGKWWKVQRFHHRLVSDVVGKSLKAFTSSKHLLLVVSHAFTACEQAYIKCRILHRDISARNIIITADGGILNDWDMAKKEDDIARSRWHEQTGTWEFMSSLLLAGHHDAHTIQDDMESFVLVVIYHALHYLPHNRTSQTSSILNRVFHHWVRLPDGEYLGGEARRHLFVDNDYISHDFRLSSAPLHRWVRAAMNAVKQWIEGEAPAQDITELDMMVDAPAIQPSPLPTANKPVPIGPRFLDNHEKLAKNFDTCLRVTGLRLKTTSHMIS